MALHFLSASLAQPPTFPSELLVQEGSVLTEGTAKYLTVMFLLCGSRRDLSGTGLGQLPLASPADQASNPTNLFNTSHAPTK